MPSPSPEWKPRFLSFESRRADEMRSLIARHGALPTVAPSMQEVPLSENADAFRFAEELLAGQIDVVVFLTGVGAETLLETLRTRHDEAVLLTSLNRVKTVVRGPKPSAVLNRWGVHIDVKAPDPNTWRETAAAIRGVFDLTDKTVAVQEYGTPNEAFYDELRSLGATVRPVSVYRWALPDDTEPLENAIRDAANGAFDIIAFTSAQQVDNVCEVAERLGLGEPFRDALRRSVLASIGPTCSERMRKHGLEPDLEASPPKMGHLVRLAIQLSRGKSGAR